MGWLDVHSFRALVSQHIKASAGVQWRAPVTEKTSTIAGGNMRTAGRPIAEPVRHYPLRITQPVHKALLRTVCLSEQNQTAANSINLTAMAHTAEAVPAQFSAAAG
jgi:hypothetical protein